jgi:hypothetical protein
MKGSTGREEYEKAKGGIITLGGGNVKEESFELDGMQRYVYIIEKVKKTRDEYPRAYAKICKSPL